VMLISSTRGAPGAVSVGPGTRRGRTKAVERYFGRVRR
jgi:hypothetical protein